MTTDNVLTSPMIPVLCQMEARGIRFNLAPTGRLTLTPKASVTPEDVETLRAHRAEVTALLCVYDAGVQDRRQVFAQALSTLPTRPLMFTPGVPWRLGVCFSCGVPVADPGRVVRCWRCLLAIRLALGVAIPAGGVM